MLGAFTATLARDEKTSGWINVRWAESISDTPCASEKTA